ncbi:MAG: DUF2975 domain-containing protein [bacterium]
MMNIKKLSSYLFHSTTFLVCATPCLLLTEWLLTVARYSYCTGSISYRGASWIMSVVAHLPLPGNMLTHAYRTIQTPEGPVELSSLTWSAAHYLLVFSADLLNIGSLIVSFIILHYLFKNYKNGEFFTTANVTLFKYLSILFVIDALILTPIINCLLVACATLSNLPGHRYLVASFGSGSCSTLWYASLILLLSLIMSEACKLNDEQQLTV